MGLRRALGLKKPRFTYKTGSLSVANQNFEFLSEPQFALAYEAAKNGLGREFQEHRWHAFNCVIAAKQALLTEGDFVECGVNTGILSMTVCGVLGFDKIDRNFFLFDTFAGVPLDGLTGDEREQAKAVNERQGYVDVYQRALNNFSRWPNAKLIRGSLPGTLDAIKGRRIAYLSIDLNSATYEMQVIDRLWSQISPGAVVVLDDYGWESHKRSFDAWNTFAAKVGHPIFQLPTGQGLIHKWVSAK
jgi:hypothetical protein